MLVKVGDSSSINMRGIYAVYINTEDTTVGYWWNRKKKTTHELSIDYLDGDGVRKTTKFWVRTFEVGLEVKNEVLTQVKELENVGATQALEEAIKNG